MARRTLEMRCFRMAFPILAFLAFAFAASVTPGPNNVMLAAAAANRGMRATVPMMIGINTGFAFMILLVGLGLATPLSLYPRVHAALRWIGIAWMLYLAWKIANAGAPGEGPQRPLVSLPGAAALQWVNPKAWVIVLAVVTTWTSTDSPLAPQILTMAGLFFCVGIPSSIIWSGIGASAARLLHSTARLRRFNQAMGALLAISVLPLAFGD